MSIINKGLCNGVCIFSVFPSAGVFGVNLCVRVSETGSRVDSISYCFVPCDGGCWINVRFYSWCMRFVFMV